MPTTPESRPEPLISPALMFQYRVPCYYTDQLWEDGKPVLLDESYRIPCFAELAGWRVDGPRNQRLYGDLRVAWNEKGLYFELRAVGKRMAPNIARYMPDTSDGLQLYIDTRNSKGIHRAGRFCHRFFFAPPGPRTELIAEQYPVPRAIDHPRRGSARLQAAAEDRIDGFILRGTIAATQMDSFDPEEHPLIGFTYLLRDREFGAQYFSLETEYRFQEDPSLWGTLELTKM